ncbi:hypothetical protein A1Q2_03501 [Trichosporon asahii var. asahii CBS 8904]|uniref:Etoposide-induced protein 2.4-domain-containing protein n=1 Tax=Trichosporon asahii var. asahii (strain CBS 8904) TaxID=1220162 RepID=K1WM09_TRIAC|nr:hypothetical protein A1Q2_03501 [Trichosporon asahii var. asahii CBS 8904]
MIQRRRPAPSSTPSSGPGSGFSSPAPTQQNTAYQPLRHDSPSTPPRFGHAPAFTPRANHVHNGSLGNGNGFNGFSPMMGSSRGGFGGMTGLGQYVEENESGPMARRVGRQVQAGVRDMAELGRSWSLVWGDPELRTRVLKVTTMNLISLLLLSLLPLMAPVLSQSSRAARVGFWYNVLLNWPMFAVCFAVNAYWGPGVAKRAQSVMHPASSTSELPAPPSTALLTLTRLLLIGDFTLVSRSIALVPIVGRPIALAYMALVNAYYAYEWIFANRDWPLARRCAYIGDRAAYMFGFGLIPTLLTSFFPPLINMAIFTLLYPFLLIQALHSRPPAAGDVLPAGSGGGQDDSGAGAISPALGVRVPIFMLAQNALVGAEWLLAAVGRERGGALEGLREKMGGKY